MDPKTSLRRRVGDTPLQRAPKLAEALGLPNLRIKLEGANPTGTQKDRIARLELASAVSEGAKGVSVASCGNFGVAMAHAAYVHDLPCHVFVPEDFTGERVTLMKDLGAKVHRAPGAYEDAVQASREHARSSGFFDANPGGSNTLGTLAGYSKIAEEIIVQLGRTPDAVGLPIGNGSTLAGVHLGFRTAWAQGRASHMPSVHGGSSRDNNPVVPSLARGQQRCTPLDPQSIVETDVNEPLVNWDSLDGTACLSAIQDSRGSAYGATDDELMQLHAALLEDGIDAHPASLAAAAALGAARKRGALPQDADAVVVLTSGRPEIWVAPVEQPDHLAAFNQTLASWLGRFGDPADEMEEAVSKAFETGCVLEAHDREGVLGYVVLTPMELSTFFPGLHLSYIAVDPRARGRGVGTVLLEEAIRAADGDLSLHVETDNEAAIRLYEKFGFTKKYYRMLHASKRTPDVDPAQGAGWADRQEEAVAP